MSLESTGVREMCRIRNEYSLCSPDSLKMCWAFMTKSAGRRGLRNWQYDVGSLTPKQTR